jgi:hypothetical protein
MIGDALMDVNTFLSHRRSLAIPSGEKCDGLDD